MKKVKETKAPAATGRIWLPWIAAALAALAAFKVYEPALGGEFVFDDRYLPFLAPGATDLPLGRWLGRTRPVLMLSFWLQLRVFGLEPYSYHIANLVLHLANSALVFLILRRLMDRAAPGEGRIKLLSAFGAALFLLHPLQTESVSYVASRSEVLSATFLLGAFAVFLHRRGEAISFLPAGTALALFAAAFLTKEHTAVLPALFLLTDYYWYPGFSFGGIRKNWRLYALILWLGAGGFAFSFISGMTGKTGLDPFPEVGAETSRSGLQIGKKATVASSSGVLNIRTEPNQDAPALGLLPTGAEVTILDGPVTAANGLVYWKVQADNGLVGWCVEAVEGEQTLIPKP